MKTNKLGYMIVSTAIVLSVGCGGEKKAEAPAEQPKAAAAVDMTKVGSITGSVKFEGTAPKPAAIKMSADPVCVSGHTGAVTSEDLVVNSNNTVKNVIVRIKDDAEVLSFDTPTEPVEIDQVGCVYTPHVAAVLANQSFVAKNGDNTMHNVHYVAEKDGENNVAQPAKGIKSTFTFTAPQHVKFKCDVHSWMSAHVLVVDNPFYAVTGDDGSFTIKNVPAGDYTVETWHESGWTATAKVTVAAQAAATADFTFKK